LSDDRHLRAPHRSLDTASAAFRALVALIDLAARARRIVALTGAGISTESGIPDYRGPGGVWERQAPPTIGDFLENPDTRRAYWEGRRTRYPELAAAQPNDGHRALARWEQAGRLTTIITQNIDGLHQKAGNTPDRVIELHGSAHRIRCFDCGTIWPSAVIQARLEEGESLPACEVCGGILRAATILFGEALPKEALERAVEAARGCDLMLVVGSSLIVNPAAQLPVLAKRSGASLAIVNRTPTPLDALADVTHRGEAGPALSAIAAALTPVSKDGPTGR
jgi:NAD-dependent deacetylase